MSSAAVLSNSVCNLYDSNLSIEQQLIPKTEILPCPNVEQKGGFFYRKFVPLFTAKGLVTIHQAFRPKLDEEKKSLQPDLSSYCYCLDYPIDKTRKRVSMKPQTHSQINLSLQQLEATMKAIGAVNLPVDNKQK